MVEERPFFGDWQKVRKLGSGGFGEVVLWKNRVNNQCVAVKKCFLENRTSKERNSKTHLRWLNEIDYMDKKVKCDNIVQTAQVDTDFQEFLNKSNPSGLPVLIMDFHDGGDLRRLLNKTENSNGLPEIEVRNILKSLAGAIKYLHSINIAHRDIKPENIVIQKHNRGSIYKLTDLGYARELQCTIEASQVGTVGYFAPEVIMEMQYSLTVDYWSFGIIVFEVICGCRPFIPHQTIPQWIMQLKNKGSKTIAITEDNDNVFQQHHDLFLENQIANNFKKILIPWFVLALEYNSKQRGYIFETRAPDESPSKVLRIFLELEAGLEKKILTIFAMSSYKFLSYEVTESMSLAELIARISVDTGIPHNEIYMILPIEHNLLISSGTKPIDLYQNESNNTPMVYVTCFKHALQADNINPEIPTNLHYLLSSPSQKLKPWYLLECARHALFFLRNEQKHFITLLRGIKYYALTLDHEISLFNKNISLMENRTIQLRSAFELCMATVSYSKTNLEQKNMISEEKFAVWRQWLKMLEEKMETMTKLCFKVTTRYNSVLRRSKEAIEYSPTKNYNNDQFILSLQNIDQDYFKVTEMERIYEIIREDKLKNSIKPTAQMEVYQAVCECLETRSKLLKSGELKNTQITIGEIHDEYLKIRRIVSDISKEIENQLLKIKIFCERHIDEFALIIEEATTAKYQKVAEDIPMIDDFIETLKISDDAPKAVCVNYYANQSSMEVSLPSFGNGPDAKDVIGENRGVLQALKDLTMELEDTSQPI